MNISISVEGIGNVASVLDALPAEVHENMWDVLKRLTDEGVEEAEKRFAEWGGDDGNTVMVDKDEESNEHEITIWATGIDMEDKDGLPMGNTVVLEEFGAGSAADSHPLATRYGIYPGQWSKEQGQQQWQRNPEWWAHKVGEHVYHFFTEIPATRAMYEASEKMKRLVKNIVKEVFK